MKMNTPEEVTENKHLGNSHEDFEKEMALKEMQEDIKQGSPEEQELMNKVLKPKKLTANQKDHNKREAASLVKKDIKRKRKMKLAKKARKMTKMRNK